jgi:hypothetical protein
VTALNQYSFFSGPERRVIRARRPQAIDVHAEVALAPRASDRENGPEAPLPEIRLGGGDDVFIAAGQFELLASHRPAPIPSASSPTNHRDLPGFAHHTHPLRQSPRRYTTRKTVKQWFDKMSAKCLTLIQDRCSLLLSTIAAFPAWGSRSPKNRKSDERPPARPSTGCQPLPRLKTHQGARRSLEKPV